VAIIARAENDLKKAGHAGARRFDLRDYRAALGRFVTGVAVVTARTVDGRRVGLTVNSFTSLSLEPPLVLWCLAREATHFADFEAATHFAVNVLGARQYELSRQFSASVQDRFAGVECLEAGPGCPLLVGVIAHFVCRAVKRHEGGDHVIFIGEVESYEWSEGEPLVFHSGRYGVPADFEK
jgi:flavin reductase (DIM6/NTAB) family NADH-FMN oxidoreductase RutF